MERLDEHDRSLGGIDTGEIRSSARGRDTAADDAALSSFGTVDPVDWSVRAVRSLMG